MRHLGIVAHSVEGAALCLRCFCQEGFSRLGADEHPDVSLDCIALARSMPAWRRGDEDALLEIRAILSVSVQRLARADADFFVCADNTAHLALEQPGPDLALPGLHIAEVVADQAAAEGRLRVGVLGTRFVMDGPVYRRALTARGIAIEVPGAADRALVDDVIFQELVNGVVDDRSRTAYLRVIDRLAEVGCDAVALACTEIPLLVTPEVSPLPTLDSTRLLARAAFDVATGARELPGWRGGPVPARPGNRAVP
jgi:aspartate racemase